MITTESLYILLQDIMWNDYQWKFAYFVRRYHMKWLLLKVCIFCYKISCEMITNESLHILLEDITWNDYQLKFAYFVRRYHMKWLLMKFTVNNINKCLMTCILSFCVYDRDHSDTVYLVISNCLSPLIGPSTNNLGFSTGLSVTLPNVREVLRTPYR